MYPPQPGSKSRTCWPPVVPRLNSAAHKRAGQPPRSGAEPALSVHQTTMIQVPRYEIRPPSESTQTAQVPKPEPETDPIDIIEMNQILGPFDRGVLFSGGIDSLVLTHLAMEQEWVDVVVHLQTNSSISQTPDYVRRVCEEFCWPLIILRSPMPLEVFACCYGFPGAVCHTSAYNNFKGRQLQYLHQQTARD